jgi:hypothetical protein
VIMSWITRFRFPAGQDFSFCRNVPTVSGVHTVCVVLSGSKRLEYEPDHLPFSDAEVKNVWSYTPTPPHVGIDW